MAMSDNLWISTYLYCKNIGKVIFCLWRAS